MFIDEARIRIKAGDGGNGCMAFRREKFVPRGGPSGGDGGHGGDIVMRASLSHNTLIHFRFNPEWKSERGSHGLGSNMSGHQGEDRVLEVPVGTVLYDDDTGELIHDFASPGDQQVIARGGRGGRGNQHFANSVHQAPREHELGRTGEARNYRLELRLLADCGLVGFPNVGKSTLISRLSAARPKIANYPFTTLEPNLGVVQVGEPPHNQSFTVADMPGLIEGAHLGAGLGIQFLRHIERTAILVHLVDISDTAIGIVSTPPTPGTEENTTSDLSSRPERSEVERPAGTPSSPTASASVRTGSPTQNLSSPSKSPTQNPSSQPDAPTQNPSSRPEPLAQNPSSQPEPPTQNPSSRPESPTQNPSSRPEGAARSGETPVFSGDGEAEPVETADPVENYRVILNELRSFDPNLAAKPTLLVATKLDAANPDKLRALKDFARRRKLPFFAISAVTGEGVDKLKYAVAERVAEHRKQNPLPPDPEPAIHKPAKPKPHFPPPPPNASGSKTR